MKFNYYSKKTIFIVAFSLSGYVNWGGTMPFDQNNSVVHKSFPQNTHLAMTAFHHYRTELAGKKKAESLITSRTSRDEAYKLLTSIPGFEVYKRKWIHKDFPFLKLKITESWKGDKSLLSEAEYSKVCDDLDAYIHFLSFLGYHEAGQDYSALRIRYGCALIRGIRILKKEYARRALIASGNTPYKDIKKKKGNLKKLMNEVRGWYYAKKKELNSNLKLIHERDEQEIFQQIINKYEALQVRNMR